MSLSNSVQAGQEYQEEKEGHWGHLGDLLSHHIIYPQYIHRLPDSFLYTLKTLQIDVFI